MLFNYRRLTRNPFLLAATTGVALLAVACSSGATEPTDTPRPTQTAVAVATATSTPVPTATSTPSDPAATVTPLSPAATALPLPTATAPPTATATATPPPTATSVPAPTVSPTATSVPPTDTPVIAVTPGVVNTVELVAAKDNTLYQSSIGATSNGAGRGLFVGLTNNDSLRRALVQFDIASAVPAGATIESVELSLTVTRTVAGGQPVTIHRATKAWGEGASDAAAEEGRGANAMPGDATWTHSVSPGQTWQTPGGDFVAASSAQLNVQASGKYTWLSTAQLVADVQAWIDSPSSNFGWVLRGDEAETKSTKRLASREDSSASVRPALVIRFTPAQ